MSFSSLLQLKFVDNTLQTWLVAIGITIAIVLAVSVVRSLVVRRFAQFAKRTDTSVDDLVVYVVRKTHLLLVCLPAFWIAGHSLDLPDRGNEIIKGAASLALVLQLGLWIGGAVDFWVAQSRERAMRENAGAATSLGAIKFVVKLVLWAVLVLVGLDNIGVDVTAMVAGLGVGGVAVALAVQNILGDLFASLSIVIDKPFEIGDFIVVDDCAGTVEHVGLKTTRVRALSGEQLVFANSDLLKARVHNYKRMRERRIVFKFGILYETSPALLGQVPEMVAEIIKNQDLVRFDRAHFASFGDSSYDFEVVYWMLDPDYNKYMDTQQAINLGMVRRFADEGIGFAYPTRTLHVASPVEVRGSRAGGAAPEASA
ncbi:mechanosensitive ion channel family protein [Solimonas marina]|uniref:Mechanosensitive ion channel family protein n=1 Tax=Solimonas marina TaxID=2714601 RepID=A0A969WA66_9GAMM|nr:mechanosensitive ion channel family protein [Solimonas marina]NKF22293.1 mechanosensitive ion channel family protein [Solimonas marina]